MGPKMNSDHTLGNIFGKVAKCSHRFGGGVEIIRIEGDCPHQPTVLISKFANAPQQFHAFGFPHHNIQINGCISIQVIHGRVLVILATKKSFHPYTQHRNQRVRKRISSVTQSGAWKVHNWCGVWGDAEKKTNNWLSSATASDLWSMKWRFPRTKLWGSDHFAWNLNQPAMFWAQKQQNKNTQVTNWLLMRDVWNSKYTTVINHCLATAINQCRVPPYHTEKMT